MNKITKLCNTCLDTLQGALKERKEKDELLAQVWTITGFRGEQAEKLIRLLLVWHFVVQDRDIQHQLAAYGVAVVLPETKKDQ